MVWTVLKPRQRLGVGAAGLEEASCFAVPPLLRSKVPNHRGAVSNGTTKTKPTSSAAAGLGHCFPQAPPWVHMGRAACHTDPGQVQLLTPGCSCILQDFQPETVGERNFQNKYCYSRNAAGGGNNHNRDKKLVDSTAVQVPVAPGSFRMRLQPISLCPR